eukprot:scaffold259_cov578-Prasinococcus_capsulatus_cf.AAC.5
MFQAWNGGAHRVTGLVGTFPSAVHLGDQHTRSSITHLAATIRMARHTPANCSIEGEGVNPRIRLRTNSLESDATLET